MREESSREQAIALRFQAQLCAPCTDPHIHGALLLCRRANPRLLAPIRIIDFYMLCFSNITVENIGCTVSTRQSLVFFRCFEQTFAMPAAVSLLQYLYTCVYTEGVLAGNCYGGGKDFFIEILRVLLR